MTALSCDLAGETVLLLAERALWWPATATLFIADLHLGKAATFRAQGLPVPAGTTQDNLGRLSRLVAHHGARRIVVLGDFLHAASGRTHALHDALLGWRAQHAALEIVLVRGNHDRAAGDPSAELAIDVVREPWLVGPFAACHHPQLHPTHQVLAGHVHPAVVLRGAGREVLRLPCFCADPGVMTLPAFGAFTGNFTTERLPLRQRFAIGGGQVWRVPEVA